MPPRPRHRLHVLLAAGILLAAQTGCLWHREATVSPQTVVSRQLCRQGIAAMERNQWDEAEPLLAKAIDVCPEAPDARVKYADLLWRRNQHAEAVHEMAEAIRLEPDDASFRVSYGEMQLALGNLDAARKEVDLALDMDPKLPGAWALRGRLSQRTGKPREALTDLHRAESLAPENTVYPQEIAALYLALHQPDLALATLQTLAPKGPASEEPVSVLVLKGKAYSAMNRHDDAANTFLLAASRGGADCNTLYLLAEAQLNAGHPREAAAAAQKVLSLDPQHAPSQHLLAQLGLGQAPLRR